MHDRAASGVSVNRIIVREARHKLTQAHKPSRDECRAASAGTYTLTHAVRNNRQRESQAPQALFLSR